MAKVARRRPGIKMPFPQAVYDLDPPFNGCDTVIVMHRRGMNWIYKVEGIKVTTPIGNHDCDDPDETIRGLGYWVQVK